MTSPQLQALYDAAKAVYADPDPMERSNPFDAQRRVWTRTWPQQCPWCGDTFFSFIPDGAYWQPYQVAEEPKIDAKSGWSKGVRATCGHPLCRESEDKHQLERSPTYQTIRHEVIQARLEREESAIAGSSAKPIKSLKKLGPT